MGCCFSQEENQIDPLHPTEVDPLINPGPENRVTTDYTGLNAEPEGLSGQRDEQSALSQIIDQTVSNVISVAPNNAQGIEEREYKERIRAYNQRLAQALGSGSRKKPEQVISHGLPIQPLLSANPISTADIDLINKTCQVFASAVEEIRVTHREDLVVILGK